MKTNLRILLVSLVVLSTLSGIRQTRPQAETHDTWKPGQISAFQYRWANKDSVFCVQFNDWGGLEMKTPLDAEVIRCCNPCMQQHAWCNTSHNHPEFIIF